MAAVRARYPDVPVAIELVHGLVDECLSRRQRAWDLIVVGRHPVDSFARRLTGPMATAVLQRAHSVVAVVPETVTNHEAGAGDESHPGRGSAALGASTPGAAGSPPRSVSSSGQPVDS
jgi:hypothetical protein